MMWPFLILLGIFVLLQHTPPKTNMDTQKIHLKKASCLVSMLNFGGVSEQKHGDVTRVSDLLFFPPW